MKKANYGIDAPPIVRNLFLGSLTACISVFFSFYLAGSLWFWLTFILAASCALAFFTTGIWMVYSTCALKPRLALEMIADLQLEGDEVLLDVGCGRGLFLIEAAKSLPNGKAIGIDLWQQKDQSGNTEQAALRNAQVEGVGERVLIQTADMRALPFPDEHFDVIVSSLAIHNLPNSLEREKALSEIVRVLKKGGRLSLLDIQHTQAYASFLADHLEKVACSSSNRFYCPNIRRVGGKK
jgi:cyclopropane fatty-acyl-phospholipid synthase-like methyltransferase